jgi:hypothetical protein
MIGDGEVVTVAESNVTVMIELGMKFEPVIVTVVPEGPLVGFNDIDGITTVKVTELECAPSDT